MSPDLGHLPTEAATPPKMKPWTLAAITCLLAALVVALVGPTLLWKNENGNADRALNPSHASTSSTSTDPGGEPSTRSPVIDLEGASASDMQLDGPDAPASTRTEDFLAAHWGARWSSVRQQLLERGVTPAQLEAEIDPSTIPTWEEVESEIQESVLSGVAPGVLGSRSPEEVSTERYLNAYGGDMDEGGIRALAERAGVTELGEAELSMSLEIVESFEEDYREAAERAARADAAVRHRIWDAGEYASGPLFAAGGPDSIFAPHQGVSSTVIHKGWNVQYFVDPSSSPQLARAMDDLLSIRRERERALRAYWGR